MNNLFEDPIQFAIRKKTGDIEIIYSNLMEISQGGPQTGNISINGNAVSGRFGGPYLINDNYIYIPIIVKKILGTGFRLARINVVTFEIEFLTRVKDLIFLEKIEGKKIYFFEDLNKLVEKIILV